MTKIKSPDDLRKLRAELLAAASGSGTGTGPEKPVLIKVAMATCGIASGAKEVMDYLKDELEKRNIQATITKVGCMGYCYAEPTIEVTTPGHQPVVFGEVTLRRVDAIIEKYIKNGEPTEGIIPVNYQSIDN